MQPHQDISLQVYRDFLLRLWLTPGAGSVFIAKLFTQALQFDLESSAPVVGQNPKFNLDEFARLSPAKIAAWTELPVLHVQKVQLELAKDEALTKYFEHIKKLKAKWCCILDPEYPAILRQIYTPPAVVTWQGNLALDWDNSLAIVGSRAAGQYASSSLDLLLPELVAKGFVTISGGAVGVDSMVHQKTLALNGQTVVVLGSGLGQIYPTCNEQLFSQVIRQNGAVISIFPPDLTAHKGTFPARNRIISGLAPACLVVQAAAKSGALITASYALDQNRDVMTIPGPINDSGFDGNHKLLRQGATFVANSDDLLLALGQEPAPKVTKSFAPKNETQVENSLTQDPLLEALKKPMGLEELACKLQQSIMTVQEQLFDFQLAGIVVQNTAGTWQRA